MNDYGYARSIVWNLASAGEILFGHADAAARDAETLLRLDEEEIEGLLGKDAPSEDVRQ